jgi:hypothetical protein
MRTWMLIVAVAACGSQTATRKTPPSDPEAVFGPLDVGADYASYTKLTDKPFLSLDHGDRWVDVYVNAIGAKAYDGTAAIPVGTIVVKTSVLDDNGAPGSVAGPIYVMEKRAKGYAPEEDDWWYAIHWEKPDTTELGPIYWRGKSPRVDYCADCHTSYERGLGGLIPSSILKR